MEARPRLVPLDGSFNFRDLGGYPTRDGRVTRWGTLFRSDTLHELSTGDVALLRSLGLTTIVDLRTSRELERTGRGPLGPEPIAFHHLSVIQDGEAGESVAAPASPGGDLTDRYLWYLDVGRRSLVTALALVADAAHLPLVFHCAAGKDRTGVLAALILSIIGVEAEVIVDDYLITEGRMELILGRYRSDPAFADRISRVPASRFGVKSETMVGFLGELERRFGGARAWALEAGLTQDDIDGMEELLLDPVA
jgi:protein-tyrosine phosphatase